MAHPNDRSQKWQQQHDSCEAAIDRALAADDQALVARLFAALMDLEDERCESCGKFEDDPSDQHATYCLLSKMPRPSIDYASTVPVLEQIDQILKVVRMPW